NKKGFLVLGTDAGLFYSQNDGDSWTPLQSNVPTAPVYDLKFHKQNHDLLVATHGRGLFVLDDIRPLEELTPQVLSADLHVFGSGPAYKWAGARRTGGGFGTSGFSTPNPMRGAVISYYLPNAIEQPNRGAEMARGGAAGANAAGQPSTQPGQAPEESTTQSAEQNPGASESNQAAFSAGAGP